MYKIVPGSLGRAPRFEITCGLQEGYGPTGKLHTVDEVVGLVEGHLKARCATGLSYLTGCITTGTVVYAWPESEGKAWVGHEPQVTYSGNVNPLYNGNLEAAEVIAILDDLAAELGAALGQTRVYVAYNGQMWILQREDSVTPRGETV